MFRIVVQPKPVTIETRLKRDRIIRYLAYKVNCSVAPINLSLLNATLHSSLIKSLNYKDTIPWCYSVWGHGLDWPGLG